MVEPGAARRQCVPHVERREAQRPTSLGACAPKAVTLGNQEWPWAHGWPDRKGCPKGAVAQRPGASRRSIPLVGKRKKGKRRTRPPRIRALTLACVKTTHAEQKPPAANFSAAMRP